MRPKPLEEMTPAELARWACATAGWLSSHRNGPTSASFCVMLGGLISAARRLRWDSLVSDLEYCLSPHASWWNVTPCLGARARELAGSAV
jgi:hypothetical protein